MPTAKPGPSVPGDPASLVKVDSPDDFWSEPFSGEDPGIISDWPELVEEEEEEEEAAPAPVNQGPAETADLGVDKDIRKSIEELP